MTEGSHTRGPERLREGLQSPRGFSLAWDFSICIPSLPALMGGDHPEFQLIFPQQENPTKGWKPIRKPRWGISSDAQGCAKFLISIFSTRRKQCLLLGLYGALSLLSCSPLLFLLGMQKPFFSPFFP